MLGGGWPDSGDSPHNVSVLDCILFEQLWQCLMMPLDSRLFLSIDIASILCSESMANYLWIFFVDVDPDFFGRAN